MPAARVVWHSVTCDGDVPIREDIADDGGLIFTFNIGDWYVFRGRRVYVGEHIRARSDQHLQVVIASYRRALQHQPATQTTRVYRDALHQ